MLQGQAVAPELTPHNPYGSDFPSSHSAGHLLLPQTQLASTDRIHEHPPDSLLSTWYKGSEEGGGSKGVVLPFSQ